MEVNSQGFKGQRSQVGGMLYQTVQTRIKERSLDPIHSVLTPTIGMERVKIFDHLFLVLTNILDLYTRPLGSIVQSKNCCMLVRALPNIDGSMRVWMMCVRFGSE